MDYQEQIIALMRQGKEKIRARCAKNARAPSRLYTDPADILQDPAYAHAETDEEKRRFFREVQKEYDIRGFVSRKSDDQPHVNFPLTLAFRIGAALASIRFQTHKGAVGLRPGDVFLIGRDNGPDSAPRAEALAKGLATAGVNVVMLGVSPSGELYNAVANLDAHGGAQVTRSHVEININGVKLLLGGVTLFGDSIKEIFDWVERNQYRRMRSASDYGAIIEGIGEAFEIQRLRYLQRYEGKLDPSCPVAIDLGGGTAVKYRDTLTKIFPTIVRFFRDADDPFSTKGLADPTRLDQRNNYAEAYDFSVANPAVPVLSFDLDADRFGLLLDGKVWKGDTMMLPVYEEQLARKPGTPVRIDARTNLIVDEAVKYWKGKSICQAIGHSKVKKGMDLDLEQEAKLAGYQDVELYVQDQPARAETFQGEFSLHLFRYKPERNDEGRYVGTPVDDAIDFACYFVLMLQKRGKSLSRPCLQLPEYLDMLRAQGIIGDSYTHRENNIEIRTDYDPMLKKNLGYAAFEIFRLIAGPDEEVTWIDDGVSAIAPGRKLMLRFSNTSPKVTMKCDARPDLWIEAASRLLGVFLGITDYLIAHRGLDRKFRTISRGENEFLYEIFATRAGKDVDAIAPFPVGEYLGVPSLRDALEKDL